MLKRASDASKERNDSRKISPKRAQRQDKRRDKRRAQSLFSNKISDNSARVLIVGRPNTGKSTLFNRLLRIERSPMTATAGMTQDWIESELILPRTKASICLIDTAGAELDSSEQSPSAKTQSGKAPSGETQSDENQNKNDTLAWHKTSQLIEEVALILFVLDARAALTSVELDLAKLLRGKRVIVVANKAEGLEHVPEPCLRLGFADLILVSALQGRGIDDLLAYLDGFAETELVLAQHSILRDETSAAFADEAAEEFCGESDEESGETASVAPNGESAATLARVASCFSLALLGMANSGKSTLANRLIGNDRFLVSATAGTTRNATDALWREGDEYAILVDTAGLRRRSRVTSRGDLIEQASSRDSLRFLRVSSVMALVIDCGDLFYAPLSSNSDFLGVAKQSLIVAHRVLARGKPLILLMNKWDLLTDTQRREVLKEITSPSILPDFQGLPIITLSALYDNDFSVIFKTAKKLHLLTTRREKTAKVNAWLEEAQKIHRPPIYRNRQITLRYASQVEAAPPRFVIHANAPVANDYIRYLKSSLRKFFDWPAVPIVIKVQKKIDEKKLVRKKPKSKPKKILAKNTHKKTQSKKSLKK